jgi:hypothetical protein
MYVTFKSKLAAGVHHPKWAMFMIWWSQTLYKWSYKDVIVLKITAMTRPLQQVLIECLEIYSLALIIENLIFGDVTHEWRHYFRPIFFIKKKTYFLWLYVISICV